MTCPNIIGIVIAGAAAVSVHRVGQDDANQMGKVWQPLQRAVGEHEQLPAYLALQDGLEALEHNQGRGQRGQRPSGLPPLLPPPPLRLVQSPVLML